jgi:hypothetical protein
MGAAVPAVGACWADLSTVVAASITSAKTPTGFLSQSYASTPGGPQLIKKTHAPLLGNKRDHAAGQ